MKVKTVDGRETDGVRLLLAVVEHAEDVPGGVWSYSAAQGVLVDSCGAVWSADGGGVARVVLLPCRCACAEVTTYRDGVECSRMVGPAR